MKDVFDFLASYPLWVKLTLVALAAAAVSLLVVFRPGPKADQSKSAFLRIERLETNAPYKLIALLVTVNGNQHRFPSGYNFAAFEQYMAAGEYPVPLEDSEVLIDVQATVQFEEDRRLFPTLPPNIVTITLEFRLRQPIRLVRSALPNKGVETLRAVEGGVQRAPREHNIQVHYSVQ